MQQKVAPATQILDSEKKGKKGKKSGIPPWEKKGGKNSERGEML